MKEAHKTVKESSMRDNHQSLLKKNDDKAQQAEVDKELATVFSSTAEKEMLVETQFNTEIRCQLQPYLNNALRDFFGGILFFDEPGDMKHCLRRSGRLPGSRP